MGTTKLVGGNLLYLVLVVVRDFILFYVDASFVYG